MEPKQTTSSEFASAGLKRNDEAIVIDCSVGRIGGKGGKRRRSNDLYYASLLWLFMFLHQYLCDTSLQLFGCCHGAMSNFSCLFQNRSVWKGVVYTTIIDTCIGQLESSILTLMAHRTQFPLSPNQWNCNRRYWVSNRCPYLKFNFRRYLISSSI